MKPTLARALPCSVLLVMTVAAQQGEPAAQPNGPTPSWVWHGDTEANAQRSFRRVFRVRGRVQSARLFATCDNHFQAFVNGEAVLRGDEWSSVASADVTSQLRRGQNVLAISARNDSGPAALAASLVVTTRDGRTRFVVTDRSWRVARSADDGWTALDFDDRDWDEATELGAVGEAGSTWGPVTADLFGGSPVRIEPQAARPADTIDVVAGFEAEFVFDVPKSLGSWVSLAVDPKGRLIASDQGRGLYRITPASPGDPVSETVVERIDVDIGGAHGLLWAFDSLYVAVNGSGSGLYRVRDTDGDDRLDSVEKLRALRGAGEHGPHAIALSPDGESLYVGAGNHTDLTEIAGSRNPRNWGEDLLLPRQWDARGHARGRLAPGGWICKVDPDGERWELVSAGYRNDYDFAFNPDGELFAYDADMEWDMGMPWYRPTRVCHAVSGSEFGWRSGTGKWATYYEDSLPPVVDIGPGSPTGVVFGTGAKFPARYQRALFILDWTFGTIYTVRLSPDGASYRGETEEFLSGRPLALTDAVIGHDGALYFAVGGRGTKSALYRVVYRGDESTAPVRGGSAIGAEARALRHELEAFHGREDARAIPAAWGRLSHRDRFVRYAARLAVESQPVERWQRLALDETDPSAAPLALLALARQASPDVQPALLESLAKFDFGAQSERLRLTTLRAYALAFVRMGEPSDRARREIIARLDPYYPSGSGDLDTELARVLVYLRAPSVVEKTLPMIDSEAPGAAPGWADELIARNASYGGTIRRMLDDMPPVRSLQFAFFLRNVRHGWTLEQRKRYFRFFIAAKEHPGGASYSGFLENMRKDALANCSDAERRAVADITGEELSAAPVLQIVPPRGPGRVWTVADATAVLAGELRGRDFDRGRNLFHAVACVACHRFDGEGGDIGPDLSTLGNKYAIPDVLEAVLEPSKVISDQYGSSIVTRKDGTTAFGRVVERGDDGLLEVYSSDPEAPAVEIDRADVRSIEPSPISQMPPSLVNVLNADELRDLVAYLMSRGDREDSAFRK